MNKFKPVLKFVGVYLLVLVALFVIGIIAVVLYLVFSHGKTGELQNTIMYMSSGPIAVLLNDVLFFVIPLVVAWKLGLLDLSTEFRYSRETFSK